jgi:hypothetical protein
MGFLGARGPLGSETPGAWGGAPQELNQRFHNSTTNAYRLGVSLKSIQTKEYV